jgi:hypothetical protein
MVFFIEAAENLTRSLATAPQNAEYRVRSVCQTEKDGEKQ